jgi:hypothetical protein
MIGMYLFLNLRSPSFIRISWSLKGNLFQAGGVFEQISDRYQRADPVALDLKGDNRIGDAGSPYRGG